MIDLFVFLFFLASLIAAALRGDWISFGLMLLVLAYLVHKGYIRIERK